MPRVYERKFDHDEARKLRAEGWSYRELAARFGVSDSAILRVCNPQSRAKMEAHSAAWSRRQRQPCRGGCGRLVWHHGRRIRSGYCPSCLGKLKTRTVRPDTLLCTHCGEWKLDEEFPFGRTANKSRRDRHSFCRGCQAEVRREHRQRNREADNAYQRAYKRRKRATAA
jgi:hypothetical protein